MYMLGGMMNLYVSRAGGGSCMRKKHLVGGEGSRAGGGGGGHRRCLCGVFHTIAIWNF